ncbi:uncharacterized protein SAZU_7251 [Streptomyces azureus]|uniref:Uncharacterized protein n=1 Tax=Streptomyces azureus TaxID=146537 RepID=A0A0K8PX55_STRAJ|nr:uncharacterized protein SAZU_7251 [Streptomyces azureus]
MAASLPGRVSRAWPPRSPGSAARWIPNRNRDGTAGDMHRCRVPESGVRIFVRADEDAQGQAGEVWSLRVSPAWWREAG